MYSQPINPSTEDIVELANLANEERTESESENFATPNEPPKQNGQNVQLGSLLVKAMERDPLSSPPRLPPPISEETIEIDETETAILPPAPTSPSSRNRTRISLILTGEHLQSLSTD